MNNQDSDENRRRRLFHVREVHKRCGAIGDRAGQTLLAALLGMAATVIRRAHDDCGTSQTRASKHYQQEKRNEN